MPKIVTVMTKYADREWAMVNKNPMSQTPESDILTPEDVRDYLEPARLVVLSLPGILPEKHSITIRGDMAVTVTEFDTLENAQSAYDLLYGENPPEVCTNLRNLVESEKYKDIVSIYSFKRMVQP